MKIEKTFEIKQSREQVWDRLNDVRFVAECLPGASIVSELGENRYKGTNVGEGRTDGRDLQRQYRHRQSS